jgi:hypothetical protein
MLAKLLAVANTWDQEVVKTSALGQIRTADLRFRKPTTCYEVMGFETPREKNLLHHEHLLRLHKIARPQSVEVDAA